MFRVEYPIYTIETECQDCYKCVRHCPVKAINVGNGHATVVPELCIACGHCVEICPAHAKKVRDDSARARELIKNEKAVYVSLAPSWISDFENFSAAKIITALKLLGFTGISETALGAQAVSANVSNMLKDHDKGALISSACPVVVDYIRKYQANFVPTISKFLSPALAHAGILRQTYGKDIAVVFIGPCIAKKNEADRHPELIDAALTFNELRDWFTRENINLDNIISNDTETFIPEEAAEGAIYPIGGGMNKTLQLSPDFNNVILSDFDGLENLKLTLNDLTPEQIEEPIFIEALACHGGCVHGPGVQHKSPGLLERLRVIGNCHLPEVSLKREYNLDITDTQNPDKVQDREVMLQELQQAMRGIGKTTPEDELNCGGCGYDTCRNFATALVLKKAETSMCVSFMRKNAQKKANALLRTIPSGVVIVDQNLKLVECNRRFAEIFGTGTVEIFDAKPGMSGADLKRLVPFYELFNNCLNSGKDIYRNSYRLGNRLLDITIFSIETNEVAGAVIVDVTNTELRREQIAKRASEVINKNLNTVQDIACKLGEHMAETEILLRSISEEYADDKLLDDIKKEFKMGADK
jgi:iron only hydrogenase large subunit-like protein